MSDAQSFGQRFRGYRPSKALWFWTIVGSVILTVFVGFSWGGWVGPGTADRMAEDAAEQARAELAATICVDRFINAEDASVQLAKLKDTGSWQQDDFIEKGGWTTPRGVEEPVAEAAELCADRWAEVELPPEGEASQTGEGATVVQ